LEELDANRSHIYDKYEPNNGIQAILKPNEFYLTVDFMKKKLGVDEKQIREAWLNQKLTIAQKNGGKIVDYKTVSHKK